MADIYFNIAERTGGEIYAGVVGPVRTGKSTFIKRFMELFVIDSLEDPYNRSRVIDQLPQSGDGRTITTTEPKFIPEEAVRVSIGNVDLSIRMVDCVGYIVPGVLGHEEDGRSRMVKTPWDSREMTFQEAAELGTSKVITDHSTVGIMVTTDGSFGDIPRENYISAEEKTVAKLTSLKKPFVIILNSSVPSSKATSALADNLSRKYEVPVLPVNCMTMDSTQFEGIFEALLTQFPVSEVYIDLPDYMEALSNDHPIKASIMETAFQWMNQLGNMAGIDQLMSMTSNENIDRVDMVRKEMATGRIYINVKLKEGLYYRIIEEILGESISSDKELFHVLKDCAMARNKVNQMSEAFSGIERSGYGIVHPNLHEMSLGKPEVFKQGNKYGVRIVATAPCLHMIKTNLTTEIAPIVGSEQQSQDLAGFLMEKYGEEGQVGDDLWETNLFGKSMRSLVTDQMNSKLTTMPDTLQDKVRRSLQKISNEGKDYFICIIL